LDTAIYHGKFLGASDRLLLHYNQPNRSTGKIPLAITCILLN